MKNKKHKLAYISVKIEFINELTEQQIQDTIMNMDYWIDHAEIESTEIKEVSETYLS